MGIFGKLFGKKKESLTFEEADQLVDHFAGKQPVAGSTESEMVRQAAKLMTSQKFAESIKLYKDLAEKYPDERATYTSQIGVGYYFLGNYEKAIEYYVSALEQGEDRDMMDDNIWEATEELYKQTSNKSLIENYLELFPDGGYKKKASKLL